MRPMLFDILDRALPGIVAYAAVDLDLLILGMPTDMEDLYHLYLRLSDAVEKNEQTPLARNLNVNVETMTILGRVFMQLSEVYGLGYSPDTILSHVPFLLDDIVEMLTPSKLKDQDRSDLERLRLFCNILSKRTFS